MTRTVAIIQARMSSTRLPGKVLEPLLGMPLIIFMWQRVLRTRRVDDILLATSLDPSDDRLAAEASRYGLACHRGELNDVLARFEGAARAARADVVVRLTGDCPLIDPDVIDRVIEALVTGRLDYASNSDPPTYPDGLDVEAFTWNALVSAHSRAQLPSEREHVTPYIRNGKALFKQANIESAVDMSALRWTVDHADDLAFVRGLLAEFPQQAAIEADRFDILRVLDRRPELAGLNPHTRNEGYAKSLQLDALAQPGGGTS